jgi:hypothetical protein
MSRVITPLSGIFASLAFAGLSGIASTAWSDATLVYATVTADVGKTVHTFSIRGRFIRVDMDSDPNRHWVIDTGLLTIADVDRARQQYTFEKLPRPILPGAVATDEEEPAPAETGESSAATATPAGASSPTGQAAGLESEAGQEGDGVVALLSPEPALTPTRKKESVAGIGCRVVIEKTDKKPVAEHCMAGTGELGLTSREMITLSRMFTTARRLGLGWAGAATPDERIVSISSRLLDGEASQVLQSVSHDYLENEQMQVPKAYQRIKPGQQQTTDEAAPPDTGTAIPGSG